MDGLQQFSDRLQELVQSGADEGGLVALGLLSEQVNRAVSLLRKG